MSREHARLIWDASVDAVRPAALLRDVRSLLPPLDGVPRIVVVGAGKAGSAMAIAFEDALGDVLPTLTGWINVPAGSELPTRRIHLHPARPKGSNFPTEEGVVGSREILRLVREAGPTDLVVGLWSGGGSALLPAPAHGVTLDEKQKITKLLHACGATINEMNCVRKHLSDIKGGRLAEAFCGTAMVNLIVSDVVGDPLDVIASGPTSPDPTTFADARAVLQKFNMIETVPEPVRRRLERGAAGEIPETPKSLPGTIVNRILGNNAIALAAAKAAAMQLGYRVFSCGSAIEGDTQSAAHETVDEVVTILRKMSLPLCLLSGGETTVTLLADHGLGGRNQEFVLAMLCGLGPELMKKVTILSGGTDGEDGPTDAAGAIADAGTFVRAAAAGLNPADYLRRHDAYPFFRATGDLLVSGPTNTNVMDVRVILMK
jgi:glycerate 2-kinase